MQTIKPHLLVSILFIQMVIPASRCCRTIWMAVWEDIAPPRKLNIFAPEKWCLENYFPLFFKVVPPFPGDMLHNFFGECILHSIWRISSISILRHNPHAVVSLKKRPLKSIKFPPQKPNKSEILTSIVVHDFLLRGLAATSRSREMIIDRWNLNDKEAHHQISQAGLFHPKHGGLNWPWLSIRQSQKGVNRKPGFSLLWFPFSWRKSQIKLHTKLRQFMMLIFSKWFVHQSTYFPTRCYQMLSWTLNLDLYCKQKKVLITTSMGLEANQPHTTSPSHPWNPLLLHCKKSDKNLGLKIVILPHLLEGSHTFTSLPSMLWDPKNWGHGASIFLRYTINMV